MWSTYSRISVSHIQDLAEANASNGPRRGAEREVARAARARPRLQAAAQRGGQPRGAAQPQRGPQHQGGLESQVSEVTCDNVSGGGGDITII